MVGDRSRPWCRALIGPFRETYVTFPVVQSVLDPVALEKAVGTLYDLGRPLRCRLVSRSMNDVYHLTAGPQQFAVKVARAERSDAVFAFEPAFIDFLDRGGFAVPTPLLTADGRMFFAVDAPEGPRQVVVMRWLPGVPLTKAVTEDQAHQLGAWLARIHQATAAFKPQTRRLVAAEDKLKQRLPALLEAMGVDRDMAAFLVRAGEGVAARVTGLDPRVVPRGICHGDFHYANVMVLPDRAIGVLDFADCGEDFLAADLAAFFWRADVDGVADQLVPAFIAGYDTVRRLAPPERAALPLFRAARHLGMAAAFAQHANRVGPIAGFDENRRYYLSMIRLFCAQAGIT